MACWGWGNGFVLLLLKHYSIKALGEALGYRHVESHFAFMHRSLTREIAVFEKVQKQ